MEPLTHAEQNRLITANLPLVEPIAGLYRGQKGIPFEDLCQAGAEGLVRAARRLEGIKNREAWFYTCIEHAIIDFIRGWEEMETGLLGPDGDPDRIFEWSIYQTPYESWERLDATPEEILAGWQEIAHARNSLSGAMLSLDQRERAILGARFLRDPPQKLESIARELKISHARVVFICNRALKKLKKILEAQERNVGVG